MSEPKRGLGRGLSALLGEGVQREPIAIADGVHMLSIASIFPNPDQPRRHFDEAALDELAASLREKGLLQPIVVRPHDGAYQIVAGERRWRAAQRAHLHQLPALVRTLEDRETFELAIIENIQRQDLNPIEEAEGYQRLVGEWGHSQEGVARIVGKSRSHVANLMRLLDLPGTVRTMVATGDLGMGHARALITAADPETLAHDVVQRRLSVRETEALARRARPQQDRPVRGAHAGIGAVDTDTLALQRQLGDLLGLAVTVRHEAEGGTITLAYSTLDQLDMICRRLSGGSF